MKKFLLALLVLIILPTTALAINSSMPEFPNPFDELQIKIPNMPRFSDMYYNQAKPGVLMVPWIAEYIKGIYNYGISIIGILALICISIGGVIWVTAGGSTSKIGVAKSWIKDSVFGISVALLSYLMLALINKNLVTFGPLQIATVAQIENQGPADLVDTFAPDPTDQNPESADIPAGPTTNNIPIIYQCSKEGQQALYNYEANGNHCKKISASYSKELVEPSLCTSGCGVVSLLMIFHANGLKPSMQEMANIAMQKGARVCDFGSSPNGLSNVARANGLKTQITGASAIAGFLDKNIPVILRLRSRTGVKNDCLFTDGGHFIVLTGWKDKAQNLANVNDPANSRKNPAKTWTNLNDFGNCELLDALAVYK